jgi:hypothetical protein
VQSVPIVTKVVNPNPVHGGVYSILHVGVSVVNVVQQQSIPRQGSYIYTSQFIYGFSFIKFQVKHTLDKELKSGLPFYFNEIKGLVLHVGDLR